MERTKQNHLYIKQAVSKKQFILTHDDSTVHSVPFVLTHDDSTVH